MDTADRDPTTPYRTLLKAQGGHSSAADLTADGHRRVLAELARLAGKPAKPKHGWQADKIARLWRQLGELGALKQPDEAGLNAFVLAKTGVAAPRFLRTQQANRMIETLKAWLARELRKQGTPGAAQ
jgi:phage gp16-like protein